ncbi:hypothetical protein GQ457_10G022830 [Hibiscus cannabinus]
MVSPTASTGEVLGVSRGEETSAQVFSNKRVNVCLDDTNFLLWKQQVILTIRGLGLEEFLDPDVLKPSKYVENTTGGRVLNPEYVQFVKQDSSLASWLLSTVSSDILPQLVGADTSADIWNVITGLYSKLSTTKLMHLHCKLRSMKKGAMSMREYTMKIKEVCDLLALSGRKVAEVEHIATILNGLPPEFAPFVAVITASKEPFSLDGVVSVLVDAESRLLPDVIETPIGINLTQAQTDNSSGQTGYNRPYSAQGRGRGSRNGSYNRGGRFRGRSRPQCQLCGKIGHMVDTCWYRFDEGFKGVTSQRHQQSEAPQANTCHYQGFEPYYEPFVADTAVDSGNIGAAESSQPVVDVAQCTRVFESDAVHIIPPNDRYCPAGNGINEPSVEVAQEVNTPVCDLDGYSPCDSLMHAETEADIDSATHHDSHMASEDERQDGTAGNPTAGVNSGCSGSAASYASPENGDNIDQTVSSGAAAVGVEGRSSLNPENILPCSGAGEASTTLCNSNSSSTSDQIVEELFAQFRLKLNVISILSLETEKNGVNDRTTD